MRHRHIRGVTRGLDPRIHDELPPAIALRDSGEVCASCAALGTRVTQGTRRARDADH
jgi:hypothetical protein